MRKLSDSNNSITLNDNKKAFTLAEVLITLGIIGVVAALTIPNLMNAHKAARYRSQFLKSYSTLQQVFRLMQEDGVSTDPTTYAHGTFYKTFGKYLKGTLDCERIGREIKQNPCWTRNAPIKSKTYKTFNKKSEAATGLLDDGQLVLPDGTNVYFENNGIESSGYIILVSVDINGYMNPPNRWGYDLFTFEMVDGELKASGERDTAHTNPAYCSPTSTDIRNGIGCAVDAKNNPDYFKKIIKELK